MDNSQTKIAIVGAGPAGMVALKEFRDLGFDVTVFEKRSDVGGVWTWTEDAGSTTALKETRLCNNKYSLVLGDFPLPKDFPWIVSAPLLGSYFRSYAKHYDLYRSIQFNKTVTKLTRDEANKKWQLALSDSTTPLSFDKIVWATGGFVKPKRLTIPGQEAFNGKILHSSQARDLSSFKNKKVVVLGIGNTAADVANALVQHSASKIYLSHRRGAKILNPTDEKTGAPSDLLLTTSLAPVTWWLQKHFPSVYGWMTDSAVAQNFKQSWGINKPEWGLAQSPSVTHGQHVIVCNQDLVPNIQAGRILSVPGIKSITGPNTVTFDDGNTASDIDAIITCIGYDDDMGLLNEAIEMTPSANGSGPLLPNLYMNIFPPAHADSFAHISLSHLLTPQIPGRVLAGLALSQIWAGRSALPSQCEMSTWIAHHQAWLTKRMAKAGPNGFGYQEVDNGEWNYFLHGAAGTGLYEHVGWGWRAWGLWWRDRELYRAVANLPICAYTFMIFDMGKRKPWDGAREAVVGAHRELEELKSGVGKKGE